MQKADDHKHKSGLLCKGSVNDLLQRRPGNLIMVLSSFWFALPYTDYLVVPLLCFH